MGILCSGLPWYSTTTSFCDGLDWRSISRFSRVSSILSKTIFFSKYTIRVKSSSSEDSNCLSPVWICIRLLSSSHKADESQSAWRLLFSVLLLSLKCVQYCSEILVLSPAIYLPCWKATLQYDRICSSVPTSWQRWHFASSVNPKFCRLAGVGRTYITHCPQDELKSPRCVSSDAVQRQLPSRGSPSCPRPTAANLYCSNVPALLLFPSYLLIYGTRSRLLLLLTPLHWCCFATLVLASHDTVPIMSLCLSLDSASSTALITDRPLPSRSHVDPCLADYLVSRVIEGHDKSNLSSLELL